LSAGAASLEEAFLQLTGASIQYGRYPADVSGVTAAARDPQREEGSS